MTSAFLVGVGAPVAGQTAERTSSPTQEQPPPNSPGAEPDESFAGYVGYVGAGGAASTAAPTQPDQPKAEQLGPVGSNSADNQDVPGEPVEAADDSASSAIPLPTEPDPAQTAAVESAIAEHGSARVIVMMQTATRLEADLSASQVETQHDAIADSLDGLQDTLRGTGSKEVSELEVVPSAVYEVTAEGLDALLADPSVASVVLDGLAETDLAASTGVIDSDLLNAAGVLGDNFNGSTTGPNEVAIIDTGVDSGHNAFKIGTVSRIVRQACFVTDFSCPGGLNQSFGAPSGEACTHSTDCDHGTHVAGITAGSFYSGGHEGVARGAGIVAIKVAQDRPDSTRAGIAFSSIDNALQHVLDLKNTTNPNLVAVNISIGGGLFASACDAAAPTTALLVNNLLAAGVATVIAAGNDFSQTQVSRPGCVSNALTISATDNADNPAGFSNSNALTDFWAPGVNIDAPVPTGNNHGAKSGTSMATPHVVGALALLRECVDDNGVPITNAKAISDLAATGVNVSRNGVTRKRINVLDAATRNVNNNDFAFPETFVGDGPFNEFDFNVCADSEAGEPGPFSLDNSIWWTWTPATSGTATISTEDSGSFHTTFDSTLAVYTGNTLPTLSLVAADDDSGTGLRSLVRFPATAGTTYRIKVDGYAATNGLMNLHIEVGPPPSCFRNVATIIGTPDPEVINGTAGNDVILGLGGNDTINGLAGNDIICAGSGNDTVNGADGTDFVLGEPGADLINGDAGNDTLIGNEGFAGTDDVGDRIIGGTGDDYIDAWVGNDVISGGAGNDTLKGMAGVDYVDYSASPAGVSASLTSNTATGEGSDTLVEVENLLGSQFNDVLIGNAINNIIRGLNGHDRIDGQGGNDAMGGGLGNDLLVGRSGNDAYFGELGNDTASFAGSPAPVTVNLTAGTAAGEGADTLAGVENVIGSAFNDDLIGDAAGNLLDGRSGHDRVRGLANHDLLLGGVGDDLMAGGDGNDQLVGAAGNDRLFGEAGIDSHNGGAGNDLCNGGLGLDFQVLCEVIISIP